MPLLLLAPILASLFGRPHLQRYPGLEVDGGRIDDASGHHDGNPAAVQEEKGDDEATAPVVSEA
ncbi:MAG TPA: hypothetical protein VJ969_10150 [Desulfopila sp.]|nr:hypothetical protein [Desulfopila sp.]